MTYDREARRPKLRVDPETRDRAVELAAARGESVADTLRAAVAALVESGGRARQGQGAARPRAAGKLRRVRGDQPTPRGGK